LARADRQLLSTQIGRSEADGLAPEADGQVHCNDLSAKGPVIVRGLRLDDRGHVVRRPIDQILSPLCEAHSGWGDRVLDRNWHGCYGGSRHQAIPLEIFEALGQDFLGQTLDGSPQFVESDGAPGQLCQDQQRPLVGYTIKHAA